MKAMKVKKGFAVHLLKELLRIRMAEEILAALYPLGEMRTPVHFSIGQEAAAVGVAAALGRNDTVFASHRCHAAYLASGGDLNAMVAELYGRATGTCGGRAGSAHLSSPERMMYSSPILGELIPVAVGTALSFNMDRKRGVAVCFFGDAAPEEGVFAESVNFAVLKRLPVLFICENNQFSTHTHIRYRQPDIPVYKRAAGLGLKACRVDGNDVIRVYAAARRAVDGCRRGKGPAFIECATYRYREHVGPNYDFENPYRTKEDVKLWMRRCPVERLKRELLKRDAITEDSFCGIARDIRSRVNGAVDYARRSPWPGTKDMTKDVY